MGQGTVDEPFETPLATPQAQQNLSTSDAAPNAMAAETSESAATVSQEATKTQQVIGPQSGGPSSPSPAPSPAAEKSSSGASVAAASQDSALEYDSMVLMSKLEQYVIKLSDKAAQASLTLALDYLVELTNHIVAFAEKLSPTGQMMSIEALLVKDQKNYGLLTPKHVKEHRLDLGNDPALTQDELSKPQTFGQFSNDILRVINIYLSINVKAFHTPRVATQWQTLYKGFYKHLISAIRQIQAAHNN